MEIVIGLGEYAISNKPEDYIKTYALSSCVAITTYCREKKALGMVHIVLPNSTINPNLSIEKPCYFADTAVPFLIQETCKLAYCSKDDLIIGIFGGAKPIRRKDIFNIGDRNVEEAIFQLNKLGIKANHIDTSGAHSRTLMMDVSSGTPKIYYQKITF
jgi:chemotaxis protein CheD